MVSDSKRLDWSSEWQRLRARRRARVQLTAIERKWLLIAVDLVLVNCAFIIAVASWNEFPLSGAALVARAEWFVTLSALWLVIGTILDVYNLSRASKATAILASAGSAVFLTAAIYLAIPWVTPAVLHRSYAAGFILLAVVFLPGWRVLYARALVQPAFTRRALIVGGVSTGLEQVPLIHEAQALEDDDSFRGTGYDVVGRVSDGSAQESRDGIPLLGDVSKLVRLAYQYKVDEIIVAPLEDLGLSPAAREVLLDCRELGLRVTSLASVYERQTGRLPVDRARYDVQLVLSPPDTPGSRLYAASKRGLDIVLSILGLVGLGLILPFIALANAFGSPGPLFYRQERIGKGCRPFTMTKFRSMVPDAERRTGAVWSGKGDPRITKVGYWLRRSRLDEVPQLINVLRGEMSIVGPRPERPSFVGPLSQTLPLYRARNAVKPGLTGWAQVHYEYGDSVEDSQVKLEYDLYYVKHASLYLDLLVMLHTVRVVLGLKGR
jgi:exopolysaccharide biosynthesis polyprenyl glycosylphosphotransferase